MMSTCAEIRSLLPLYVGGDLEAHLAVEVEAHLATGAAEAGPDGGAAKGCADCLAELEAMRVAREALLRLPELSRAPELDVWPQVRAGLAREGRLALDGSSVAGVPDGVAPAAGGRLLRFSRRVAAAAAVLLTAGGLLLVWRPWQSSSDAPLAPPPGEVVVERDVGEPERATGEPGHAVVPVAGAADPLAGTGLRRLLPGEEPLGAKARLYVEGPHGWTPAWPAAGPGSVDPSRPTLAGDRSLR